MISAIPDNINKFYVILGLAIFLGAVLGSHTFDRGYMHELYKINEMIAEAKDDTEKASNEHRMQLVTSRMQSMQKERDLLLPIFGGGIAVGLGLALFGIFQLRKDLKKLGVYNEQIRALDKQKLELEVAALVKAGSTDIKD